MREHRITVATALAAVAMTSNAFAQGEATGERVTLDQAVQRALARNPSAAIAAAEIKRADALIEEARAAAFPTITATGTYTRLDSDRTLNGQVISAANQLAGNITLAVPIIAPQRWATWSHAGDDAAAVRATSSDVRRQIAVTVARAYLAVVAEKRILEADQRALAAAKAHRDFAKTRFEGGLGNKIDAIRAEQEVQSDEAQVAHDDVGVLRAREALGVTLGIEGPADVADDARLNAVPTLDAALRAATERDDVRALELRERAAAHAVRDNWTDYAPLLLGTFQPFYQNPPTLVQPKTGWQAQLILTIPIYDGGLRYGLADEREARRLEAHAQLDAALRQAKSDVRAAFDAMRRADDALRAARAAADLAQQALELATTAYRAGATTNLEVIDAERRARDAESAVAVAEDGSRQARLDFLGASGRFP